MATSGRPRRPRKPRSYCPGSGKSTTGVQCPKCYREVRVRINGTVYSHYAKAPTSKTDPKHSAYVLDKYGITGEEYELLLAAQGGVCYICRARPVSKRLAVDHDHDLGFTREAVRGLLCRRCNHRLLGSAHDETTILKRAIDYLDNPPARKVLNT